MIRKISLILILTLVAALTALPAAAGDLRGPGSSGWDTDYGYDGYEALGLGTAPDGWAENSTYTYQAWDFLPVGSAGDYTYFDIPLAPDAASDNPNGTAYFYATGQVGGTAWTSSTDYGMGMENFDFYGHVAGMGSGYAAFSIPTGSDSADMTVTAIVEYIVYLNTAHTPEDMVTAFASDSAIEGYLTGTMDSREWEQLDGPGGTGYWWVVTEEWTLPQLAETYFYLETANGTATMIDAVAIQTVSSPVPVPGTGILLGAGLISLLGMRRRFKK